MIADPQGTVLVLFAIFCRIGACIMTLPGFSSARISTTIRFFLAFAVSLAMTPLLFDTIYPRVSGTAASLVGVIVSELLIGLMYGLVPRLYVLGLQFAGSAVSMAIGLNTPGAMDVLEDSSENQMTNLISFGGLLVLFMLDFHHVVFRALVDSYAVMPLGGMPDSQKMLITLTDTLSQTFMLMLRLASPFLIFGLMFNFAVGLVNKLAPQVPVFYISTPYLLMGGLLLVYFTIGAMVMQFAQYFPMIFNF
ncbi:flagellar biosynthetic protein FliR [Rhizobium rosettiformans]|jgi:flagellar biosynthesis protein FliR|uniref:Flagellar biosynthetic protein FliR n=2 Tax=Rhizobium rosettiformans TaxID=1368430 RepID=A0A4S8PV48_9HYPH|nr:flagellar biosynthetic protein FliR [Rhizobium rosettiformans]MBA4795885.1 flagellar type III secretion system protein FliR [Hyphomicrobiales bacterium]MBB5277465.1 flagellar biosynthetic protein FliR [Rhizobium rosettiformans]MDR7028599.1 flagellar biosynthetic protein FliR [Rhizobium rosettiformans]MDR7064119.1 flagellar biosynthetic protein FliR [Rhizobium rosettiformans]THV33805.1 flagellar type III secretion system protein FliR [Rhizobium rosettiformans W3]